MPGQRTQKALVRKHPDSYWKVLANRIRGIGRDKDPPFMLPGLGSPPGAGNAPIGPFGFSGAPAGLHGEPGNFQGGGGFRGGPGGFPSGQGSPLNSPPSFPPQLNFPVVNNAPVFHPSGPPSVNSASAGSFQDQPFQFPPSSGPGPGPNASPFANQNQNLPTAPAFGNQPQLFAQSGLLPSVPLSHQRHLATGELAAHLMPGGQTGRGERVRGASSGYIGSNMQGGRGGGVGGIPVLGGGGSRMGKGKSERGHPWAVETARYELEKTRPRREG